MRSGMLKKSGIISRSVSDVAKRCWRSSTQRKVSYPVRDQRSLRRRQTRKHGRITFVATLSQENHTDKDDTSSRLYWKVHGSLQIGLRMQSPSTGTMPKPRFQLRRMR
jgi:hypothetical protein